MPTFDIDFEVYCARCGNGLCNQSDTTQERGRNKLTVEPCEKCLEEAKEEGKAENQ